MLIYLELCFQIKVIQFESTLFTNPNKTFYICYDFALNSQRSNWSLLFLGRRSRYFPPVSEGPVPVFSSNHNKQYNMNYINPVVDDHCHGVTQVVFSTTASHICDSD